jgi:hypothetical protein
MQYSLGVILDIWILNREGWTADENALYVLLSCTMYVTLHM